MNLRGFSLYNRKCSAAQLQFLGLMYYILLFILFFLPSCHIYWQFVFKFTLVHLIGCATQREHTSALMTNTKINNMYHLNVETTELLVLAYVFLATAMTYSENNSTSKSDTKRPHWIILSSSLWSSKARSHLTNSTWAVSSSTTAQKPTLGQRWGN